MHRPSSSGQRRDKFDDERSERDERYYFFPQQEDHRPKTSPSLYDSSYRHHRMFTTQQRSSHHFHVATPMGYADVEEYAFQRGLPRPASQDSVRAELNDDEGAGPSGGGRSFYSAVPRSDGFADARTWPSRNDYKALYPQRNAEAHDRSAMYAGSHSFDRTPAPPASYPSYISSSAAQSTKMIETAKSRGKRKAIEEADEAPRPLFFPPILMERSSEPRQYRLHIRQSPKHGQMCTLGSKSRRILDPLPIVQLDMRDQNGKRDLAGQASPYLLMQVSLIADHISDSEEALPPQPKGRPPSPSVPLLPLPHQTSFPNKRLLEGKLFASAHIVRDAEDDKRAERDESGGEHGKKSGSSASPRAASRHSSSSSPSSSSSSATSGAKEEEKSCFFIFSDLSIRSCGVFRLQFSLIRMGGASDVVSTSPDRPFHSAGQIVAKCTSKPFPVVHHRDFDGLSKSTRLAKSLASQGVHIPIRNESKWRSGRKVNT